MIASIVALVWLAQAPQAPPAPPPALKATIRMEVGRVPAPIDAPSPVGDIGGLVARMLTPDGATDMDYVIAGNAVRVQLRGRLAGLPRGAVVIQHVGGEAVQVLNDADRTWYEMPASANLGAVLGAPDVELQPTGDTTTIAGQRAERFSFTETLRVPVPEGVNLPPQIPHELTFTGDIWSTDAFAGYASIFKALQSFAAVPGMEALTAGGRFPMRMTLRSSFMPGYELRSEVTSIATTPVDPAVFAVPAGYQKIPAPTPAGIGVPK